MALQEVPPSRTAAARSIAAGHSTATSTLHSEVGQSLPSETTAGSWPWPLQWKRNKRTGKERNKQVPLRSGNVLRIMHHDTVLVTAVMTAS